MGKILVINRGHECVWRQYPGICNHPELRGKKYICEYHTIIPDCPLEDAPEEIDIPKVIDDIMEKIPVR